MKIEHYIRLRNFVVVRSGNHNVHFYRTNPLVVEEPGFGDNILEVVKNGNNDIETTGKEN